MVYKRFKDLYVHIETLHSDNLDYREPGDWIIHKLRKGDIIKDDFKKSVKKFTNKIMQLSDAEKEMRERNRLIQEEMNKDFDRYLTGKITVALNRPELHNRKVKKKKVTYLMGLRTGKCLGKVINGKLVERYV